MHHRLSAWVALGVLDAEASIRLDQQLLDLDAVEQWWGNLRRRGAAKSAVTQLTYACLFLDRADAEGLPIRFRHIVALRLLIKAASRLIATAGQARNAGCRLNGCMTICTDLEALLALSTSKRVSDVGVITAFELSKTKYEIVKAIQFIVETLEDLMASEAPSADHPKAVPDIDSICERLFSVLERASSIVETSPVERVAATAFTLAFMTRDALRREELMRRFGCGFTIDGEKGDLAVHVARTWLLFASARQTGNAVNHQLLRAENRDRCIAVSTKEDFFEKTVSTAWAASLAEAGADPLMWNTSPADLIDWFISGRRLRLAGLVLTEPSERTRDIPDLAPGLFAAPHRLQVMRAIVDAFISQMDELATMAPGFAGQYACLAVEAMNLRRDVGPPLANDNEIQLHRCLTAIRGLTEARDSSWRLSGVFHDAYMAAQRLGADHPSVADAATRLADSIVALIDVRPRESWMFWRAYKLVTHRSLGRHLAAFEGNARTSVGLEVAHAIREGDVASLHSRFVQSMFLYEELERVPGGRSRLYRPHRRHTHSHHHCVCKGFDSKISAELEQSALVDCDEALHEARTLLASDNDTLSLMRRMHVPSIIGPIFERDGEYLITIESAGAADLRAALSMDDGGTNDNEKSTAADAGLTTDVVCKELPICISFIQALLTVRAAEHLAESALRPKTFTKDSIKEPLEHGPFLWTRTEQAAVDNVLRTWAKQVALGRKIDAHHGNVLVRRRHYTFIDFHYGRAARPSGYEIIQLVENARLVPVTPEGIEIRVDMLRSYWCYLAAWITLLKEDRWHKPVPVSQANDRCMAYRLMLFEALRLLRQASAPEWRVARPKDAAGMIEHADEILRVLAACDDPSVSEAAGCAQRARQRYNRERIAVSKAAAKVLRHDAGKVGADGWMATEDLRATLEGWAATTRRRLELVRRKRVVEALCLPCEDRFEMSSDLTKIRALHGHTIDRHPRLKVENPPALLYHGTSHEAWVGIQTHGLTASTRRFVHLFAEPGKASEHASRHEQPVVLEIDTAMALSDGKIFRRSNESVWLTDAVNPQCIRVVRSMGDGHRQ